MSSTHTRTHIDVLSNTGTCCRTDLSIIITDIDSAVKFADQVTSRHAFVLKHTPSTKC